MAILGIKIMLMIKSQEQLLMNSIHQAKTSNLRQFMLVQLGEFGESDLKPFYEQTSRN